MHIRDSPLRIKKLDHEADHSLPSSVEVMNERRYNCSPAYVSTAFYTYKNWKYTDSTLSRVGKWVKEGGND
jgi:hypothetical protein